MQGRLRHIVEAAAGGVHERVEQQVGDLAALEARSRVHEAEALFDPAGLGAFSVMTWRR